MVSVQLTQIVCNSRGVEGYEEETASVKLNAESVEMIDDKVKISFKSEDECLKEYEKFNIPYGLETYSCKVDRYLTFIYCVPFSGCKLKVNADNGFRETI